MNKKIIDKFQNILGYKFDNPSLLSEALTHRSHGTKNNERLEFLGDAVLNFVVANILYRSFESMNEGDLSRFRSNLVNQSSLCKVAGKLNLKDYLKMGAGEVKSKGGEKPSIQADALEAVIGAIYLDSGIKNVEKIIYPLFEAMIEDPNASNIKKDPKTTLQEILQGRSFRPPLYVVETVTGLAHKQAFEVCCNIPELNVSSKGKGASRRAAEQDAARLAIEIVGQ